MPVEYSFDGRLFRLDCIGRYSTSDLTKTYLAAINDPSFPSDAAFFVDVTRSKSLQRIDPTEIRKSVNYIGPRWAQFGKRCAILAPTDLYYSLMQIASGFAEFFNLEVEVFRNEDEALSWLGIEI